MEDGRDGRLKDERLAKALTILKELVGRGFYGRLVFLIEAGNVVIAKVEHSEKL